MDQFSSSNSFNVTSGSKELGIIHVSLTGGKGTDVASVWTQLGGCDGNRKCRWSGCASRLVIFPYLYLSCQLKSSQWAYSAEHNRDHQKNKWALDMLCLWVFATVVVKKKNNNDYDSVSCWVTSPSCLLLLLDKKQLHWKWTHSRRNLSFLFSVTHVTCVPVLLFLCRFDFYARVS